MTLDADISAALVEGLANATAAWTGGSARCVFDAAFSDPLGIAGSRTTLRVADVHAFAEGDALTVTPDGGTAADYLVREVEDDGRGALLLVLGTA